MTHFKRLLAVVGYYLMTGLFLWFVVEFVIGWMVDLPGSHSEPREDEPCGPGYRWTRVGSPLDPDLSCERE